MSSAMSCNLVGLLYGKTENCTICYFLAQEKNGIKIQNPLNKLNAVSYDQVKADEAIRWHILNISWESIVRSLILIISPLPTPPINGTGFTVSQCFISFNTQRHIHVGYYKINKGKGRNIWIFFLTEKKLKCPRLLPEL